MEDKDGLSAFLRSKATSESEVDWEAKRDRWLVNIKRLYAQVRKWLSPLEADGVVQYSLRPKTLCEDYIGSYDVDVLLILVGKQRIEFRPRATLVVGADGRVDVRGQRAERTIVLQGEQWLLRERGPHLKVVPFDKDSFQSMLEEIME